MARIEGTWIEYQGFPCVSVELVRARGYGANTSTVLIPAAAFPRLEPLPAPGRGLAERSRERAPEPNAAAELPAGLKPEGALLLREVVGDEEHRHEVAHLFVARASTHRRSADGLELVQLELVDERYFYPRGLVRRWSFNRLRPDGAFARDSVTKDGKPWTRAEIAQHFVAPSLFRAPTLAHVPSDWAKDKRTVELEPHAPAVAALARLVTESGLEEPCLRWDGTLALHAAGDGRADAQADGGTGANRTPIHGRFRLSKLGQGDGSVAEPQFPEDQVLVVGGERVATVALDDWEPVLVVRGHAHPLNEETVRKLTNGAHGLEWLDRFVLAPAAYQGDPNVPEASARLLAEQAYRLFRLPGAQGKDGAPGRNEHLLPLLSRAETEGRKRLPVTVETYTFAGMHSDYAVFGDPDQVALADALRELALIKEATVQQAGSTLRNPWIQSRVSINRRGEEVISAQAGVPGLVARAAGIDVGRRVVGALGLTEEEAQLDAGDVMAAVAGGRGAFSKGDLQTALGRERLLDRIKGVGGDLASRYAAALKRKLEIEDRVSGGVSAELQAVAREILELEAAIKQKRGVQTPEDVKSSIDDPEFSGRRELLRKKIEDLQALARRRKLAKASAPPRKRPKGPFTFVNRGRAVDAGASVYDAERGIVRTSELAGHVTKEGATAAEGPEAAYEAGPFVPCPVRVLFGTRVRPRVDVAQPEPGATTTGGKAAQWVDAAEPAGDREKDVLERLLGGERVKASNAPGEGGTPIASESQLPPSGPTREKPTPAERCKGGDNRVPKALAGKAVTDEDTRYLAAFVRKGRAQPEKVEPEKLDHHQATRVARPDLVELLPLEGPTNLQQLDDQAHHVARDAFARPDLVVSERHVYARPWPVQCDGVVERVVIRSREKNGAPCGFETLVTTGASALNVRAGTQERRADRAGRPGAGGAAPDGARREGLA